MMHTGDIAEMNGRLKMGESAEDELAGMEVEEKIREDIQKGRRDAEGNLISKEERERAKMGSQSGLSQSAVVQCPVQSQTQRKSSLKLPTLGNSSGNSGGSYYCCL